MLTGIVTSMPTVRNTALDAYVSRKKNRQEENTIVNEATIRAELATCIRMLEYLGLIDFSGHVSLRNPQKNGEILINSWGASRCCLGPQDIVRADLDGVALDENTIVPSEIHIHTAVYRRRSDINTVAICILR